MPRKKAPLSYDFLAGGGEMGERMRAFDWSKTALGPVERWPQSLRSAVSILLPSKAQLVLFWGPDLVTVYNDAYRPVYGAKHPWALGQPARQAWSDIWDDALGPLFEGVLKTGEAFWARDLLFVMERHGFPEETFFDVSYDPVRDESGAVGGIFCIVAETTGRVVGERRLALLRDLAARNAAARTAREACVLAMETIAAKPQDISFALAYLNDELQASTPGAQAALAAAQPQLVKELPIPAGKLVVGVMPMRPFDEQYASFLDLAAAQLATAIANAQAYEEERRRAEALAEIDRAKTTFFSNVSHEFRTPLTLMLGPLEELLARESGGGDRELLGTVHRNGQRLLKLVNTLLDFSRIEAGRAQASFQPTDLAALTGELASNFRAACERAGLELKVDCPPLAVPAYVDREMWEKIVLNLVSNAFKFTLEGGIEVRLAADGERLRLTVRDSGSGIPPEAMPRLFERFHRVEGTRGRSHEGSGIGLALVQELVKLHGGSIGVQSAPGKGTIFTVEMPLGSGHLPAERVAGLVPSPAGVRAEAYVSEALGWLPGAAPAATAAPANAAYVLVADDNADLRDYARRLLAEHYEVRTVSDGREAIEAARERRPDLIVSDVMMPHLDGFGLIGELRADAALRDVPVLLLSARAGEEARLEGVNRGADDYLVKPFSARELLVRAGSLLQSAEVRRNSLEALRYSSAQFKTLLDQAPLGVYLVDADFRIREVNPVARPVFGDIPGGVIGRDFDEIIHILWEKKYADEVVRIFRHTLETGEPYITHEMAELRADRGVTEYYEWRVDRIPLPDGRNGVVAYFRDISQQVLARKAIEESREALRAADQRKDEFLATLSHELRNPLAPLRNALHLMGMGGDSAPARAIMERQVNHLVRLVDDLLEMSRITRGTFELRRERVELSLVVRNAVETSEPLVQAARHRLDVSLGGGPLWLEGDPVRLAQILSNLLNNAAKYTPDGGAIRLSARREGAMAEISVRDNGSGIAPENLARIFEMFSREGRTDARGQGGLGIGLTLSRSLAQMHGGSIEARSEGPGKGSEFIVRLPLAAGAPQAIAARPQPTSLLSPMRILVVDDNRDAAASLGMILEVLGAEVRVAHDGAEALDAFHASDPAVVLLDIGMPGMDGYEVARTLRACYPGRRPALVALTGWGQEEDRRRVRAAGFEHHLVKPAEIDILQALLMDIQRRAS